MMMRCGRMKLLLVVGLSLLNFGCFNQMAKPEAEPQQVAPPSVRAGKNLTLVCDVYPPYEYEANGEAVGLSVEIVREGLRRAGYTATITIYPWARALKMIESGDVDAIFTVWKTPEREAFIDYSQAIATDRQLITVKKESAITFDGDLSKLSQYRIGVINGFSYGAPFDAAVKEGTIKVEEAVEVENNIEKLLSDRIDIYVEGEYVILHELKKAGKMYRVKSLRPAVNETDVYLGFAKKRELGAVRDKFDAALAEMKKDGTQQRIIDSYTR
ncbi:substrate-binding periplasmic protein [Azotosporobacter soli]|uniref:substrate-binding periplasmic protein n=1 Tax=Azotosporobacter soli TaxID=3055040 RepID=UPI0031FE606A